MKKLLLFIILFTIFFKISAQTKLYVHPDADTYVKNTKTLAILPLHVQLKLRPKKLKELTPEQIIKMGENEALDIQKAMHSWFLTRKKRGTLLVDVQNPTKTNALLKKSGIDINKLQTMILIQALNPEKYKDIGTTIKTSPKYLIKLGKTAWKQLVNGDDDAFERLREFTPFEIPDPAAESEADQEGFNTELSNTAHKSHLLEPTASTNAKKRKKANVSINNKGNNASSLGGLISAFFGGSKTKKNQQNKQGRKTRKKRS